MTIYTVDVWNFVTSRIVDWSLYESIKRMVVHWTGAFLPATLYQTRTTGICAFSRVKPYILISLFKGVILTSAPESLDTVLHPPSPSDKLLGATLSAKVSVTTIWIYLNLFWSVERSQCIFIAFPERQPTFSSKSGRRWDPQLRLHRINSRMTSWRSS